MELSTPLKDWEKLAQFARRILRRANLYADFLVDTYTIYGVCQIVIVTKNGKDSYCTNAVNAMDRVRPWLFVGTFIPPMSLSESAET